MNKALLPIETYVGPERPSDILWVEKSQNLQLNENWLTRDINNNCQILLIIVAKLIRNEVEHTDIKLLVDQILFYKQRDIYINNQTDFVMMEELIPGLSSRIQEIDRLLSFIKKSYNFENQETFRKQILVIIEQLQDVLNSKTFPISRLIETQININNIL